MKTKKSKAIIGAIGYFLLVIALCVSGSVVFHNLYYEQIYVSGGSMYPTLNGDENEQEGSVVDFGIMDTHESAIDKIKRFSIISTYYYDDYNDGVLKIGAKRKIKRVIGMPGDTFKIEKSQLYVLNAEGEFENIKYTFNIEPDVSYEDTCKDVGERTLSPNEYWVLGDHRNMSRDSGTLDKPIQKEYILGVLVAIEGQGKLKVKNYACEYCKKNYKGGNMCPTCGRDLVPVYDLVNRQYHFPKYF